MAPVTVAAEVWPSATTAVCAERARREASFLHASARHLRSEESVDRLKRIGLKKHLAETWGKEFFGATQGDFPLIKAILKKIILEVVLPFAYKLLNRGGSGGVQNQKQTFPALISPSARVRCPPHHMTSGSCPLPLKWGPARWPNQCWPWWRPTSNMAFGDWSTQSWTLQY